MHHSLRIAEVLDNIFAHLTEGEKSDSTALGRLARTCKAFTESALDALWWEQKTLDNLLKCLPSDCWEENIYTDATEIHLLRRLQPDDLRVVFKNRVRVRVLTLRLWIEGHLWSKPLEELASVLPTGGIFPNLRHLEFSCYAPRSSMFRHTRLLVCPPLTSVTFRLYSDEDIAEVLSLPLPLPYIRSLSIQTLRRLTSSYRQHPNSTPFALQLSRIGSLCLPTADHQVFGHLSILPDLRSLEIGDTQVGEVFVPLPIEPPPFAALAKLSLALTTVDFAIEFIGAVLEWRLQYLTIGYTAFATKERLATLYQIVSSRCLTHKLEHVLIGHPGSPDEGDGILDPPIDEMQDYAVDRQSFKDLLRFSNLTYVTLESPAGFVFDDAVVWDLARSWPALQNLILGSGSRVQVRPSTTLDALRAFATHCKHLITLLISINASDVPLFNWHRREHITQSTLSHLDVRDSPIDDSARVASFLSRLFPATSEVHTCQMWRWDEENGYEMEREGEDMEKVHYERWMEVERLIPIFVSTRREEQFLAGQVVEE
ncbi:hypothetical protein C8F01DRAFT_1036052 [Mycena amicta]|nr:hypothetical protein C8F01DRAFT_1036052 [Mycena amicta]